MTFESPFQLKVPFKLFDHSMIYFSCRHERPAVFCEGAWRGFLSAGNDNCWTFPMSYQLHSLGTRLSLGFALFQELL